MNPKQPSGEGRPFLPKDQQRFALWLLSAAILLALVVLNQPTARVDLSNAVRPIEQRVRARHRSNALRKVRDACRQSDCACVKTAARAGLDADAGKEVLDLLGQARTCTGVDGLRAEALVRSGADDAGSKAALAVLAAGRDEPQALNALALASYRQGVAARSGTLAQRAVASGGGDGSTFILGLSALALGDLEGARIAFMRVLKAEPDDVDASYNLALVAQKQRRYGEARTRYLDLLKRSPKYKYARHNLGILAHSVGAEAEARHHLEKLKGIAPGDPLIATLERSLAQAPDQPPAHVLKLGTPGAPAKAPP
jgi:tetratricopeptide (TPR) repeat protein